MERKLANLEGHIIVCGWNTKGATVIRELVKEMENELFDLVIISKNSQVARWYKNIGYQKNIFLLPENYISVRSLKKARVEAASRAIILSELVETGSATDTDARTVLAALTIEKLNPKIYTIAEIMDEINEDHLRLAGIEQVVIRGKVSGNIIAQSAMKAGLLSIYEELTTSKNGNEFYFLKPLAKHIGVPFDELMVKVKTESGAILIGYWNQSSGATINPANYNIKESDKLVLISNHKPF